MAGGQQDQVGGGRWAVYYAPPTTHPLWHMGCAWLGRDPETARDLVRPACGLESDTIAAITTTASHYGFHATLKSPFALAEGRTVEALVAAVRDLAARRPAFTAPPIAVSNLGGFRALMLSAPCPDMDALATACVQDLDGFRAPQSAEELAKRRAAGLSPRQSALLDLYGYPYVLEQFLFHMTLTERLDGAEVETAAIDAALEDLFGPFTAAPLPVSEIALFHQPDRAAPFRLTHRFPLSGSSP